MATTTEIRNKIVEIVAAQVGATGKVHAFERYHQATEKFLEQHAVDKKVASWIVRRRAFRTVPHTNLHNRRITTWQVRGYASLKDDETSELTFDLLVDKIAAAFEADDSLFDLVEDVGDRNATGIQLEDSGPVQFAGVLCHSARLTLTTIHQVPIGVEPTDDLNIVKTGWDITQPPDGTAEFTDIQIREPD